MRGGFRTELRTELKEEKRPMNVQSTGFKPERPAPTKGIDPFSPEADASRLRCGRAAGAEKKPLPSWSATS